MLDINLRLEKDKVSKKTPHFIEFCEHYNEKYLFSTKLPTKYCKLASQTQTRREVNYVDQ